MWLVSDEIRYVMWRLPNVLIPHSVMELAEHQLNMLKVMACCVTAPGHYLNQCWLISSEIQWYFEGNASNIFNHHNVFQNYILRYVNFSQEPMSYGSVHENHRTHWTFPMARPKCLMRDFTNLKRIYKAHRTNVWWIMKAFGYTETELVKAKSTNQLIAFLSMIHQSGTKPNLVAKILATKIGNLWA